MTTARALLWLSTPLVAALGCASESSAPGSGDDGSTSRAHASSGGSAGAGAAPAPDGAGASRPSGAPTASLCPSDALPAGVHQRALSFGGQDRSYELQVPASYDNLAPVALVFDIHGYTGDKDVQESYSGVSALAEAEGFAVVRPNGTGILRSWNAGELCCGTAAASGVDDVGALRAIAAEVSASLCVDARRIYATGISNGGAMSHRLACEAADVFAAVAPVAWPIALSPFSACVPSRPIAVMHAHGTGDLIVPFHGGWGKPSSPDSFAYWASVNGCSGPPAVTFAQGQSQCETYARCAGGVEVTLCAIDGGHILYENAAGVPVAAFAWEFLSRFSLP